jgi:hypothetical protein
MKYSDRQPTRVKHHFDAVNTRKNHHVVARCQQLVHDCSEQVAAMLCCTLSTMLVNNIVHACSNNVVNA